MIIDVNDDHPKVPRLGSDGEHYRERQLSLQLPRYRHGDCDGDGDGDCHDRHDGDEKEICDDDNDSACQLNFPLSRLFANVKIFR